MIGSIAARPHYSGRKQSILVAQPLSSAVLPSVGPKAKSSEKFESVLLSTTGPPTPLGVALENDADLPVRSQEFLSSLERQVLPALPVDFEERRATNVVIPTEKIQCRHRNPFVTPVVFTRRPSGDRYR
jgi:hypothetical protein